MRLHVIYIIDFLFCLGLYLFNPQQYSMIIVATIVTVVLSTYNMLTMYKGRLTLSSVLLIYTILTQFGLFVPFALFGQRTVGTYADWTLAFLSSNFLGSALLLGNIAILSYDMARLLCIKRYPMRNSFQESHDAFVGNKSIGRSSTLLMVFVLLFFLFYVSTGKMKLFGTYDEFMEFAHNSAIYQYVLVTFYAAVIYLSASGRVKDRLFGWVVWLIIVVILALNGNKGEFLYSLLAVVGLKGVQGQKLSWKMVLGGVVLLFVVIPSITALRHEGVANSLGEFSSSAFGAFVEMGMQLRTTVYTLEDISAGFFHHLWGRSYWQPIINMLTPFMEHHTATELVRAEYPGFGYNQVAESFLNFGMVGVIAFFSFIGFILTKYENELKGLLHLALLGTVTCVLINASRNYFAFVPGQTVMMLMFYLFFKATNKNTTVWSNNPR